MQTRHKQHIAAALICLVCTGTVFANALLDDHFDNGNLATGGGGLNGGFQVNSSAGQSISGTATESGTSVTITEGSGEAEGITSLSSVSLARDCKVEWQVASVTHIGRPLCRTMYGLQGANNTWALNVTSHPAVLVQLYPAENRAYLTLNAPDGTVKNQASQSFSNLYITDPDGYTITAEFTRQGYTITSVGRNTLYSEQLNLSGNWDTTGAFTYDNLFGTENLYAAAYVQEGNNTQTAILALDRITVTDQSLKGTVIMIQ